MPMPRIWIAERLHMGAPGHVACLGYRSNQVTEESENKLFPRFGQRALNRWSFRAVLKARKPLATHQLEGILERAWTIQSIWFSGSDLGSPSTGGRC
jgi:hypothetical protein